MSGLPAGEWTLRAYRSGEWTLTARAEPHGIPVAVATVDTLSPWRALTVMGHDGDPPHVDTRPLGREPAGVAAAWDLVIR